MDKGKNKVFNSYDVAKEHGNVWIHSLGGRDYRDKELAWWAVVAPVGKKFTPDPNETVYLSDPGTYHVFVTFDDAAEWCKKYYKIAGWKRDKFGGYHPSDTGHDRPCGQRMTRSEGRWTWSVVCDKLSVDGGECNFHRSLRTRKDVAKATKTAASDAIKEQSESGRRIAEDAIAALEKESIKAKPRVRWVEFDNLYTGEVVVHAEDVLKMVREIQYLREMLGR